MADAIAVLNAGSSSIKFSLFLMRGSEFEVVVRGQIEGLFTAPHFAAKKGSAIAAEKTWPEGTRLGHDGALDHLVQYLRSELASDRLIGVGHRVVHGGLDYSGPVASRFASYHSARKTGSTCPVASAAQSCADPATPPERTRTAPGCLFRYRIPPDESRDRTKICALPGELYEAGVRRYGFHGLSYEYIASVLPRFDAEDGHRSDRRRCISAAARACARSKPAAASTRRWGSRPRTACAWVRGRVSLDPGVRPVP